MVRICTTGSYSRFRRVSGISRSRARVSHRISFSNANTDIFGQVATAALAWNGAVSKLLHLTFVNSLAFSFSRYQALLKTYEQLSSLILDTIRIEVRCRTMYYIDSAMHHVRTLLSRPLFLLWFSAGQLYPRRRGRGTRFLYNGSKSWTYTMRRIPRKEFTRETKAVCYNK